MEDNKKEVDVETVSVSDADASVSKNSWFSLNIASTSSLSETTKILAFLEGATFLSFLTARTARTASLMFSIASSSCGKLKSSLATGQEEIMMDSSLDCTVVKISSVIKGIYGCRSLRPLTRTFKSVQSAASLLALSSALYSLGFTISIYQSQNSSHIKS